MLTIDQCRHLLGTDDCSDEEIRSLRDDLYRLARIGVAEAARGHLGLAEADIEALEERAAICEHDGGLTRVDAERIAVIELDSWKRGCG